MGDYVDERGVGRNMTSAELMREGERRERADLQALIAVVAEKWLGWERRVETEQSPILFNERSKNGYVRKVHELPAADGNLCLRVADAMRAAGLMVILKAWDGGAVCIVRTRVRTPRTVAEQTAPDYLTATLRAAVEVPR